MPWMKCQAGRPKKQGWKQEVTRANRFLAQPVLPEMYGGVYHDNTYEEKDTTTPPQYGEMETIHLRKN